ncbi:MAG: hypothetical protein A2622_04590 [Bdellovibrionales bacterium RIFCSPHIGHO2_01_FULL_40_29]|nr:MAG: hypothetical protein A2622_04590 [Bdellovibrionales bacterium RIFCSPHIGHO2_01_FULL_40_29]OFZ34788.1 MAG: hypothetical protein A3D17_10785 [Bdellovibrionales bacterium RIFCSPHIGHO2_02_FULL_40_15]
MGLVVNFNVVFFLIYFFSVNLFADQIIESRYNFRFEPLRLAVNSTLNLILDIKVSSHWTAGPQIGYSKYSERAAGTSASKIYAETLLVGIRGNWFKNGVYVDGLYVAPLAGYSKTTFAVPSGYVAVGEIADPVYGCYVGYGWYWNSFNMMLGIGAIGSSRQSVVVTDQIGNSNTFNDRPIIGAGEYTLGWIF